MGRSYKDIKYDLWYNLGKLGILPGDIRFATKAKPGSKVFSYSPKPIVGANNGGVFSEDSLYLSGGSYLDVAPSGLGLFDVQEFTIVLDWARMAVGSYNMLWSYDYTAHSSPYYAQNIWMDGVHKLRFRWNTTTPSSIRTADPVPRGNIGYFSTDAYQFKSGNQKIYRNSEELASGTATGAITYYDQEVWIGKDNFATTFGILFRQGMFFAKFLTLGQIDRISNTDIWQPRPDISYFETAAEQPTLLPIYSTQNKRTNHTNLRR